MRILATCDLHYNIFRSRAPTEAVANEIRAAGGDVLMLLGDLCGMDLGVLERVFELFSFFRGPRLYVPGNHEMWTPPDEDSLARYRETLPAICRTHDVHMLDASPVRLGDVAIAGNMGWYDYSLRAPFLEIPIRFYEHKASPGTAAVRPRLQHLIEGCDDVPDDCAGFLCRWVDYAFTDACLARLDGHLDDVRDARRVIVGMHHLPMLELVPREVKRKSLQFAGGFLGSTRFGDLITRHENVSHVLCGHSHAFKQHRANGMVATAIGSTYVAKRFETIDV
jgi:predicted phosphohydrolase